MHQQEKDSLLTKAKQNLASVRELVQVKLLATTQRAKEIKESFGKLQAADTAVQAKVLENQLKATQELQALYPSPYFVKCEIKFDGSSANRIFYFAKFSFSEQSIYSWTAPAAVIRFEKPGRFSYKVGDYAPQSGELISKEQYMITDGKIVFMAFESLEQARELVYQEYFSQRKSVFLLPEIVEQMEQAQDKVIRAHYQGSFLISGAAGSGKTTLALHRVAYLLQSPDTAERFKTENTIVFVQDNSTKEYFGQLLPQLGINQVKITTFDTWVKENLNLYEYKFVTRFGDTEQAADLYEFRKSQILKSIGDVNYKEDTYAFLQAIYVPHFSDELIKLFLRQKKEKVLDRFDLTILMKAWLHSSGGLTTEQTTYRQLKMGKVQRVKQKMAFKYSLMVLDEVQNYLPEQIQVLRSCVDKNNALVYVGDLAQQSRLCTVRDWAEVGEKFIEERKVVLQKNYRSTKQILTYIKSLGYDVEIPVTIKEGAEVEERIATQQEELGHVKRIMGENKEVLVGVLAKSEGYLEPFRQEFSRSKNVHVLTINEAQGVEFDVVCLVGMSKDFFSTEYEEVQLREEKKQVNKDLLYVALTRAMNSLYVFGEDELSKIIATS